MANQSLSLFKAPHQSGTAQLLLFCLDCCDIALHKFSRALDVAADCIQSQGLIVPRKNFVVISHACTNACLTQPIQKKGLDSEFLCHYFVSFVELDADVAVERGQTTEAYRVTTMLQSLQKLNRATMTHPDTFRHCHE